MYSRKKGRGKLKKKTSIYTQDHYKDERYNHLIYYDSFQNYGFQILKFDQSK